MATTWLKRLPHFLPQGMLCEGEKGACPCNKHSWKEYQFAYLRYNQESHIWHLWVRGGGVGKGRNKNWKVKDLKTNPPSLDRKLPNWSQSWPIQKGHNKQLNVSKLSHGVYVCLCVTADRVLWIATTWLKRLPHFLPQGESTPWRDTHMQECLQPGILSLNHLNFASKKWICYLHT